MPQSPTVVPATEPAISRAAAALRAGDLVVFPTETVYGIGADATNDAAVAKIFRAKDRPRFNPLIVHLGGADAARDLVQWTRAAESLAAAFWPGPLTLVLPRRPQCPVSLLASAGLDTLAVRVPAHPVAFALLVEADRPIAAPSANRSGDVSPTTADHAAQSVGDFVATVLDGGPCRVGLESTIIDLTANRPQLLRPGGVTMEALEAVVGAVAPAPAVGTRPRAPGMLRRHYAPRLPLRLEAASAAKDEALLAFGSSVPSGAAVTLNLSEAGDLVEAAANLFAMLRQLDRRDVRGIAVMSVPETGLGRAINDRLRRAVMPQPPLPVED